MNDRAHRGTTPTSEGHAPDESGGRSEGEGQASWDAEPDMQALLRAIAARLDEVLAVPDTTKSDDVIEGDDARAVPGAPPHPDDAAEGSEGRSGDAAGNRTRTDDAEQRLRATRLRMMQRHEAAAREHEAGSATRTRGLRRGVWWMGIGSIVIAAAVAIVWLR
ncbi:MAG: hypothetical protein U5K81_02060 [Trueperaceae bacterium]|nr:hypothetical protein [Trueperaceae bacterium]